MHYFWVFQVLGQVWKLWMWRAERALFEPKAVSDRVHAPAWPLFTQPYSWNHCQHANESSECELAYLYTGRHNTSSPPVNMKLTAPIALPSHTVEAQRFFTSNVTSSSSFDISTFSFNLCWVTPWKTSPLLFFLLLLSPSLSSLLSSSSSLV